MMQRRQAGSSNSKAGTSRNGGGTSSDSSPAVIKNVPQNASVLRSPSSTTAVGTPGRTTTTTPLTGNNNSISTYWLLLLAFLLTVANYQISAPPKVQQVEHDILEGAREAEHVLEQEMRDWWGNNNNNKREPPSYNNNQNTAEQQRRTASERMAAQQQQAGDSQQHSWVEGEKRLKRELQKLVALQQQGQELGVPVLTRWLGEDIPAWAGTGVDRDAWQAQVQERYQEMRLDEERWRDRVAATLQQQAEKRG